MTDNPNTKAIIEAGHQGHRSVVLMIETLVKLNATNEQIKEAIDGLKKKAEERAKILLDQREAEKLVAEHNKRK